MRTGSSETIHATCVSIDGKGVLLSGRSGSGKSDLALRLIDRGAMLVADDYTVLNNRQGTLVATCPPSITNKFEVRGIGIIDWPAIASTRIALCALLDEPVDRMPELEADRRSFLGVSVPTLAIAPHEASAAIKLELALRTLRIAQTQ